MCSTPPLGSTYILFRTRGRGGQRRGWFGKVGVGGIIFVKNWEGGREEAGLGWLMGRAFVVGVVQREGFVWKLLFWEKVVRDVRQISLLRPLGGSWRDFIVEAVWLDG